MWNKKKKKILENSLKTSSMFKNKKIFLLKKKKNKIAFIHLQKKITRKWKKKILIKKIMTKKERKTRKVLSK